MTAASTTPHIDLNSDLGESFGRYTLGLDAQIIPLVSSCNIACGQHAGDPLVMRETVRLAKDADIAMGAHPGYPDLQGFGRRDMNLSPEEVYSYVLYQIGALAAFSSAEGLELTHVKPHGQLYNHAAKDPVTAEAVASAVRRFSADLVLVGLANSELIAAGETMGLKTAQEFFMDRAYTDEGLLVPRTQEGALIHDEDFAIKRVIDVINTGKLETVSGKIIELKPDTLCVHGDNDQALAYIERIRTELNSAGIKISPIVS